MDKAQIQKGGHVFIIKSDIDNFPVEVRKL